MSFEFYFSIIIHIYAGAARVDVIHEGGINAGMIAIVCIDNAMGMLFNKRRQSRDSKLIEWIKAFAGDRTIYIQDYSAVLFEGFEGVKAIGNISEILPLDTFLNDAKSGDAKSGENIIFFDELIDPAAFLSDNDEVIMCRWNRDYPSDVKCSVSADDFSVELLDEIEGSSHEKITIERWKART